jgi:RNA polymerase sigma-70 factor (ECF subfamily)
VERYSAPAVSLAARLVNDRTAAEDLAQEAFVRAFARLHTFDADRRFSAWFFQVLHHIVIDHLRRRRLDTVPLESLPPDRFPGPAAGSPASPAEEAERRELADALGGALAQIRFEYREAVLLAYREGLTIDEVAAVMGAPPNTVKTYLFRGRKALARILAQGGWHREHRPRETVSKRSP